LKLEFKVKKILMFLLLTSVIYFAAWMSLARPYRLFPSDDDYFRSFIDEPRILNTVLMTIRSHHPVLLVSLKLSQMFWALFSPDLSSALLFQAALSNAGILFLIGAIVFTLTQSAWACGLGVLLYAFSGWSAVYYFFYSYAPFAAMLSLFGLYFILKEYLEPSASAGGLKRAGIISGLAFWASPSAGVMIAVNILILLYLFRPRIKENNNALRGYIKSLFLAILPFSFLSFAALKDHILENCRQYAGADVRVIKTLFFSFFRVLGEYNYWFLAGFFFLAVFYLITVILRRGHTEERRREKAVWALTIGIFLGSFLIDILPSTKLARTNFALYPLFIISAVSLFRVLFSRLPGRLRYGLAALGIILLVPLLYANLKLCRELIRVKQGVPRYLALQPKDRPVYILEEDSHADSIASWLEGFDIQRIKKADLGKIVSSGSRGGLILGPGGLGSGRSILSNCCLDDFYADDIKQALVLKGVKAITLPYYAYFPPFLLEEEACEGLYFSGRRVDWRDKDKNISVFNW